MLGYVYVKSEPGLWTVGFYDPKGNWISESDYNSTEEAAARVAWLNGSPPPPTTIIAPPPPKRMKKVMVEVRPYWSCIDNGFHITSRLGLKSFSDWCGPVQAVEIEVEEVVE